MDFSGAEPGADPLEHELLLLQVRLRYGRHLPAMDAGGTSDPYVKFKLGSRVVYKSDIAYKTLNPVWDEGFQVILRNPYQKLLLKVYDHDWGIHDDFIGQAKLDFSTLPLNEEREVTVALVNPAVSGTCGTITVAVVIASTTRDEMEEAKLAESKPPAAEKGTKGQPWTGIVNVVLVKAKGLLAMDAGRTSDPYVKFKLGKEKYKSRSINHSLSPRWNEEFRLHLYSHGPHIIEMEVFDHDLKTVDDFMGKATLDLSELQREKTHRLWVNLEEGAGSVLLFVTISGTTQVETACDLLAYREDPARRRRLQEQFSLKNTCSELDRVGHLTVKVVKAQGLAVADLGGTSDPFCVLELVNQRLQTHVVYKSLAPHWNKIFTLDVSDMHSVLEFSVYDQDYDHEADFLGKLAIPLFQIRSGERRWFPLKDERLRRRARGNNPQICLEMEIYWNPVRAAVRTFAPRERKHAKPAVKFSRSAFVHHVNRLSARSKRAFGFAQFVRSVLAWESKPKTIATFVFFMLIIYCFELYMVPAFILVAAARGWMARVASSKEQHTQEDENYNGEDDDDGDDEEKDLSDSCETLDVEWRYWRYLPDKKKTLKEKVLSVQEVTSLMQNWLGYFASMMERLLRAIDFTVPFLSWLAVLLLTATTVTLYYVPVRYLIMMYGCLKFAEKPLELGTDPAFALLHFLDRVPDNEQVRQRRELQLAPDSGPQRRELQHVRFRPRKLS
ncbi:multiple C2 and transmembrane domain-containing protein-like isoform X2 [Pollicipes pollicipes]|uniref:multiple C2 and transmembrane domain-containing protein-like isoform X2 n=1 Tax=Pollicipes pollicipes TaxID=41117 RepID=UPI0018850990|nr:multiple C2 and transmembrane domain-containing protein-like isoform X2 [Pollicipes pollicipes]